ncbi:mitochondrion protein [Histoplasma capsulatum]|uniref:MICOS complex subunit MIC60 n=1 Tax=Ajellomyces capsulatus TaxID=5037 RepID=A0A8A1MHG6_AJECA|nr:mitochondrion protein [Histoplasma capsulatum]
MLRTSIASSRPLLASSVFPKASAQWLCTSKVRRVNTATRRYHALARKSNAGRRCSLTPNSATASQFFQKAASSTSTKPPGPSDADVRSPASPSSRSSLRPESIPKPPQSPPVQGQTSPGSEVLPPDHESSTPPPPPPPPQGPKSSRLRKLLYLFLTAGLAYAGGVWYSLRSDNFYDFFTEYIPYGEEAVLYLEERDFRNRFPHVTKQINRRVTVPKDEGAQVTIPSGSGLSWKVAEEQQEATDMTKKGRRMGTAHANEPTKDIKVAEKAKEEVKSKSAAKKEDVAANIPIQEDLEPQPAKAEERNLDAPRQPAVPAATTIERLVQDKVDEPVVQDLVKVFNDVISVISADESASKFAGPIAKAKEELQRIGDRIVALKKDAQESAQEEIRNAHAAFDKSAAELIRRIDEVRTQDAAEFREEFESEREKIARSYQEKVNTELQRAHEVAEQRLRNELVEQAIELNRKFLSDVKTLVENEREGRLSKLAELTANVAELERLTAGWSDVVDINLKTQQLQVAVDAVRTTLENSDVPRPFVRELAAVKELASNDEVVAAAIASISPAAYQRGIPSAAQLVERFRRVASEVRKASLLPENAGITSHAASLVLSKVMLKKQGLPTGDDVESILTRTENFLEEGNFDEAAREMNSLQGWAKLLSKDWLADVRQVLEVKQALEIIETEARLRCLQVE